MGVHGGWSSVEVEGRGKLKQSAAKVVFIAPAHLHLQVIFFFFFWPDDVPLGSASYPQPLWVRQPRPFHLNMAPHSSLSPLQLVSLKT